jgi:hypothetical protein
VEEVVVENVVVEIVDVEVVGGAVVGGAVVMGEVCVGVEVSFGQRSGFETVSPDEQTYIFWDSSRHPELKPTKIRRHIKIIFLTP